MGSEKHFTLPFDDFQGYFSPSTLDQKIVVVSVFGKTNWPDEGICGGVDKKFRFGNPFGFPHSTCMCHVEGRYDIDGKVLYINLVGIWDIMHHLDAGWQQVIQDMNEFGFLHCWNVQTNVCARALLFIFSMSHIVIIDHPSHTPDFSTLQFLKLLSFVRPKYQVMQTNLLTNIMNFKDEWIFHGRLCSPRLLFVFEIPPDIRDEENEIELRWRLAKLERSLEDRIYMTLRKSKIVKYVCNRAFYSIAPNDEFVFVNDSQPMKHVDQMEKFLDSFHRSTIKDDSDSEDDVYLNDFSTRKKEHTIQQFLHKHITKAHAEGFYDNMGKYTHVKPFFQRPTLRAWFNAANAILHDPDIGLGNEQAMDDLTSPEMNSASGTPRSQASASVAMAMYQSTRSPRNNPSPRQVHSMKATGQEKKEERRKLQIYKRKTKNESPERSFNL